MSLDPVSTWQTAWAALPQVSDETWKDNIANFLAAQTDGKLSLDTYIPDTNISFTFNTSKFVAELADSDAGTGIDDIAKGFSEAVTDSASFVVVPPISIGLPAVPTNTFSVVASSLVDTASAALGETKIKSLSSAPAVSDPLLSEFPVKLREAFLLLTVTVVGSDSTTPTPLPLTDASRIVK